MYSVYDTGYVRGGTEASVVRSPFRQKTPLPTPAVTHETEHETEHQAEPSQLAMRGATLRIVSISREAKEGRVSTANVSLSKPQLSATSSSSSRISL